MGYEIEMINVGNADAIILRYINNKGFEYVVVIDAGNKKDGIKVAEQINAFTNQKYIDLAICSHPDSDHIGGFFYLVENIRIDEFWIHDPAKHVDLSEIRKSISLAKLTKSMSKITESIDNNINLLEVIRKKGISHKEPFTGVKHSDIPLTVLGPSISFYESLIKNFRDVKQLFEEEKRLEYDDMEEYENEYEYLFESLSLTLDSDDDKSSENNSSTIIAFHPDNGKKYLFTADTGPMALQEVVDLYPIWTKELDWLDVPHHGSKKNLNSSLIKHFSPKVAFVSGKGKKKYPSMAVVNALKKVGTLVYSTAKSECNIVHRNGLESRNGYENIEHY